MLLNALHISLMLIFKGSRCRCLFTWNRNFVCYTHNHMRIIFSTRILFKIECRMRALRSKDSFRWPKVLYYKKLYNNHEKEFIRKLKNQIRSVAIWNNVTNTFFSKLIFYRICPNKVCQCQYNIYNNKELIKDRHL